MNLTHITVDSSALCFAALFTRITPKPPGDGPPMVLNSERATAEDLTRLKAAVDSDRFGFLDVQELSELLNLNAYTCAELMREAGQPVPSGVSHVFRGVCYFHLARIELLRALAMLIRSARAGDRLLHVARYLLLKNFEPISSDPPGAGRGAGLKNLVCALLELVCPDIEFRSGDVQPRPEHATEEAWKRRPKAHARTELARLKAWKSDVHAGCSEAVRAAGDRFLEGVLQAEEQAVADGLVLCFSSFPAPSDPMGDDEVHSAINMDPTMVQTCVWRMIKLLELMAPTLDPDQDPDYTHHTVAPRLSDQPFCRIAVGMLTAYLLAVPPRISINPRGEHESSPCSAQAGGGEPGAGVAGERFFVAPAPWAEAELPADADDDGENIAELCELRRFFQFGWAVNVPIQFAEPSRVVVEWIENRVFDASATDAELMNALNVVPLDKNWRSSKRQDLSRRYERYGVFKFLQKLAEQIEAIGDGELNGSELGLRRLYRAPLQAIFVGMTGIHTVLFQAMMEDAQKRQPDGYIRDIDEFLAAAAQFYTVSPDKEARVFFKVAEEVIESLLPELHQAGGERRQQWETKSLELLAALAVAPRGGAAAAGLQLDRDDFDADGSSAASEVWEYVVDRNLLDSYLTQLVRGNPRPVLLNPSDRKYYFELDRTKAFLKLLRRLVAHKPEVREPLLRHNVVQDVLKLACWPNLDSDLKAEVLGVLEAFATQRAWLDERAFLKPLRRQVANDDRGGAVNGLLALACHPDLKPAVQGVLEAYGGPLRGDMDAGDRENEVQQNILGQVYALFNPASGNLDPIRREMAAERHRALYPMTIAIVSLLERVLPDAETVSEQTSQTMMPPAGQRSQAVAEIYVNFLPRRVVPSPKHAGFAPVVSLLCEAFGAVRGGFRHPGQKLELQQTVLKTFREMIEKEPSVSRESSMPMSHDKSGLDGFRRRAGFDLIEHLIGPNYENPGHTLDLIFEVLEVADACGPVLFALEPKPFRDSVGHALAIIDGLFARQRLDDGGRSMELLVLDARHNRCKHLLGLIRQGFPASIKLAALRLVWQLVQSGNGATTLHARVQQLFASDPASASHGGYVPSVLASFKAAIVDVGPELTPAADGVKDVTGNDMHHDEINAVGFSVMHLLIYSVRKYHGTIGFAHLLLGFDHNASNVRSLHSKPLRDSCLHAVLGKIGRSFRNDTHKIEARSWEINPVLSELSHQLLYLLCRSKLSSVPVRRFLGQNDFYTTHFGYLFPSDAEDAEGMRQLQGMVSADGIRDPLLDQVYGREHCARHSQQGWFLKTLAIEMAASLKTESRSEAGLSLARTVLDRCDEHMGWVGNYASLLQRHIFEQSVADSGPEAQALIDGLYAENPELAGRINGVFHRANSREADLAGLPWFDVELLLKSLIPLVNHYGPLRRGRQNIPDYLAITQIARFAETTNSCRRANRAKQTLVEGWTHVLETALICSRRASPLRGVNPVEHVQRIVSLLNVFADLLVPGLREVNLLDQYARDPTEHEACIPAALEAMAKAFDHLADMLLATLKDQRGLEGLPATFDFEHVHERLERVICYGETPSCARTHLYSARLLLIQINDFRTKPTPKLAVSLRNRDLLDLATYNIENAVYILCCQLERCLEPSTTTLTRSGVPADKRARGPRSLHVGLGLSISDVTPQRGLSDRFGGARAEASASFGAQARVPGDPKGFPPELEVDKLLDDLVGWRLEQIEELQGSTPTHEQLRGLVPRADTRGTPPVSEALMEIACRDASSAESDGVALEALAVLNSLIQSEAPGFSGSYSTHPLLDFLERKGYLAHFIDQTKERTADELRRPAMRSDHLARASLFVRIALTSDGTSRLSRLEAIRNLRDCPFISDRPARAGPVDEHEHREMVMPIIQLITTMLQASKDGEAAGREDVARQALEFFRDHMDDYFVLVLRGTADQTVDKSVLEELSLVTAIVRELADPAREQLTHEVLGQQRIKVVRQLMLSLLWNLRDSSKVLSQVVVDGFPYAQLEREQFTSMSGSLAVAAQASEMHTFLLDTTAKIHTYLLDITANLLAYTRAVMPTLEPRNADRLQPNQSPPLWVLMDILDHTRNRYNSAREGFLKQLEQLKQLGHIGLDDFGIGSRTDRQKQDNIIRAMIRRIDSLVKSQRR